MLRIWQRKKTFVNRELLTNLAHTFLDLLGLFVGGRKERNSDKFNHRFGIYEAIGTTIKCFYMV